MSGPSTPRPSRRVLLAACGTGLAALAGCTDLGLGGGDDRAYDVGRLSAVDAADAPTRPDAFPVAIAAPLLERHYDRADRLLSAVPKRPEIANGVVARRLGEERARVSDALEEARNGGSRSEGDRDEDETGLGRLAHARYVRYSAAEVEGAYRAATVGVDRGAVVERGEALHADLRSFEADWAYRGGTPERALVVHAELERLRRAVRQDAEAWPSIPADSATDPFRVGRRIGNHESGRATLGDADRIRRAYLDGVDQPRSLRAAITGAAHRLDERVGWERRWADDYVVHRSEDSPFDRSLSDTPAEALYRRAQIHANAHAEDARQHLRDGDHASAVLAYARGLTSLVTLAGVVDAIQAGKYGRPDGVEVVSTAHEEAVAAVDAALGTEPIPVTVDVVFPASEALENGRHYLDGADGDAHDVHEALGEFAFARRYADSVPSGVETAVDALAETG